MTESEFQTSFRSLTGHHRHLSWQYRLFQQLKARREQWPNVIDLPTGLGKTQVMTIWAMHRVVNDNRSLPTRLLYVVDRRTVVDQATADAIKLQNDVGNEKLAISTLRGQLADNREWSRDPTKPAIIIGTVDLIGSALLFSGYRSGFKYKPHEAGLLGMDSLLVLDEAHLSKPFEKLLDGISRLNHLRGTGVSPVELKVKPLQIIRMSATTAGEDVRSTGVSPVETSTLPNQCHICGNRKVFCLCTNEKCDGHDLKPDPDPTTSEERNQIITRITAKKTLSITTLGEKSNLDEQLAESAGKLATDHPGSRIVIFVRTPKQVDDVRKALIKKDKSRENKIAMLTGTMRGLERDELVTPPTGESQHEPRIMQRFLNPDNNPAEGECFLISTSAGEVGFDLNADHMVCDLAPLDSLIQRLGRVNRRGKGNAIIKMLAEVPVQKKDKQGNLLPLAPFEAALKTTFDLLMPAVVNGATPIPPIDAPNASADNSMPAAEEIRPPAKAMDVSPKALAAFKQSLTADQLKAASTPEPTTVELTDILLDAWSMTSITERMPGRPDVGPWLRGIEDDAPQTTIAWRAELDLPGFAELDLEEIEEWFDTHRILAHETLSVPTSVAAKWFTDRWDKLDQEHKSEIGSRSILADRAGLKRVTINEIINQIVRKSTDSIRNADLIIPASFGGIERGKGLLDADAPEVPKDEDKKPLAERYDNHGKRAVAPDVADVPGRYREVVSKSEDGNPERKPLGGGIKPAKSSQFTLTLESDDDRTVRLISYVPKIDRPDTGQKPQSLEGHVTDVRKHADVIVNALGLDKKDPIRLALELAADFHDRGKNRDRWQRTLIFSKNFQHPGKPMAKSGGEMRRDPRGYRHEFGSLRDFVDAFNTGKLLDHSGKPITQDVFDLAMHLIAVHHGRGRPHFPKGGFDPDAEDRSEDIYTDSIRRFARLQRQYGWWTLAWLENLLRCADAMASADPKTDTYDAEGAEQ